MVIVNRQKKKSVSKFLDAYRTESTRRSYRSALRKFFTHVYPELDELYPKTKNRRAMGKAFLTYDPKMDELSLEYVSNQDQEYENDLVTYRDKMVETFAPKSIASSFAAIFKFLASNNLDFTKDWKKNLIGDIGQAGISRERVPGPTEIRRLLYNLPPQGRALTLVLASGGMRIAEALQLKLSDLELDFIASFLDRDRDMKNVAISKINIRAETTKTKRERIIFISNEARIELEKWLSARSTYLQKLQRLSQSPDESRVFPFSYATFRELWETALKKSGLYDRDERTNLLTTRIHSLRKFFRTWVGQVNPDVAECLMGHQQGMNRIYARLDQSLRLLVEGYKEAEQYLTFGEQVIVETPSEDVKALEDMNRQLRNNVRNAELDINDLREKSSQLKDILELLTHEMGQMRSEIDQLKAESRVTVEDIVADVESFNER